MNDTRVYSFSLEPAMHKIRTDGLRRPAGLHNLGPLGAKKVSAEGALGRGALNLAAKARDLAAIHACSVAGELAGEWALVVGQR